MTDFPTLAQTLAALVVIGGALIGIIKWGRDALAWGKKQTIGRFNRWIDGLVEKRIKERESATKPEGDAHNSGDTTYPIDTTPSLERQIAELKEARSQSEQRAMDQRNELMGQLEEQQRANATLTAQLEEANSEEAKHKKALEQLQNRLHRLTPDEQAVLRPYVRMPTRTQDLDPEDGTVQILMKARILDIPMGYFRSGLISSVAITDEAFNYLVDHPGFVGIDLTTELQKVHDDAVQRFQMQLEPRKWQEVGEVQADLGHFNLIDAATGLPRPIRNWADLYTYMPAADLDVYMPPED